MRRRCARGTYAGLRLLPKWFPRLWGSGAALAAKLENFLDTHDVHDVHDILDILHDTGTHTHIPFCKQTEDLEPAMLKLFHQFQPIPPFAISVQLHSFVFCVCPMTPALSNGLMLFKVGADWPGLHSLITWGSLGSSMRMHYAKNAA